MKWAAGITGIALAMAASVAAAAPGTGWSRAPDLSVYSAMTVFGVIAREELTLCAGFRTDRVAARWEREFAAREAAVADALAARHGEAEVARAAARPTRRVGCPDVPYGVWRRRYARLLNLLERRMGLA